MRGYGAQTFVLVCALAAGSQAAEASGDDLDARYARLQTWLQAGIDEAGWGEKAPPRLDEAVLLANGRFGRSLTANRDFQEGDTLFAIPRSHIVMAQDYKLGLIGSMATHLACIVYMARERSAGNASRWKPYMDMLPTKHDLPRYWEQDLIQEHMEGSLFGEYLEGQYTEMKREWNIVWEATGRKEGGISWNDFKWGHDTYHTRSVYWQPEWTPGEEVNARSSALFPFFDLMTHGVPENTEYKFDQELQAIKVYAKRPIKKGEEIMITYFNKNSKSNAEILNKWGFAADAHAKKLCQVMLPKGRVDLEGQPLQGADAADDQADWDPPTYALEMDAWEGAAKAFLAHLRARASQGAIPQPDLPEGWGLVPDPRNGWAFYWKGDENKAQWYKPGMDEAEGHKQGPTMTPPSTWAVEAKALEHARGMFKAELAKFPTGLQQDLDMLESDIPDHRVRFLVMVRRDEKQTLHWWLHLVTSALAHASDPAALVDKEQAYLTPDASWYTPHTEL